jgi:ZIP family zinc transporter
MLDFLLAAVLVFFATSLGSVFVFALRRAGRGAYSVLLAFSAGVMAFAAVEMLFESHQSSGDVAVFAGFLLGVVALLAADKLLPHMHLLLRKREIAAHKKKAVLVAGAVTLHNVPEGFAIASAFAGSVPLGWLVTSSIALQDVPEGFLVSAPLACYGVGLRRCFKLGVFSGFVESMAAIAAFLFLSFFAAVVPLALAFSAGAMSYVIIVELLPDALASGMERAAALAFFLGAALASGFALVLGF